MSVAEWAWLPFAEVVERFRGRTVTCISSNSICSGTSGTLQAGGLTPFGSEMMLISFDLATAPRWSESWQAIQQNVTFAGVTVAVSKPEDLRWARLFRQDLQLMVAPAAPAVDATRFPHVCPRCKAPAYIGFNTTDCSKGCP